MTQGWKRWPVVLAMFACAATMAADGKAQKADTAPMRRETFALDYVVQADGTYVETRESTIKLLKEPGVDYMRQVTVGYSTSTEAVEVLEAYTRKADGRRVDVPKDNYQKSVEGGEGDGNPAFSDRTTLTVVYPDLEVGDTVGLKYRTTVKTPIFDDRFSTVEAFDEARYEGDVRVRIDAPESMQPRWKAWGLKESRNALQDDRRVVEWTWQNRAPVESERKDWSVYSFGDSPSLLYSTFQDNAQIAQAYGVRALPKAVPDDRIRKLADEIAKGKQGERDVAHALYDWVATNIRYAGNCIGLGAVVPRDTTFVLDNRMGDCKDHATLLQALLTAKGIESRQALVNASSSYTLPEVPVVSMVNHVINYLPGLDLYVDSTSDSTPFGSLPPNVAGKPVLLVGGPVAVSKTPAHADERNVHKVDVTMKIAADGSVDGTMSAQFGGMFAEMTRASLRNIDEETRKDLVSKMFQGHTAKGNIAWPDAKPLLDTHSLTADFQVEQLLPVPGAFPVRPPMYVPRPIESLAAQESDTAHPSACVGATFEETYRLEFAEGMQVIAVPPAVTLDGPALRYVATTTRAGNVVTIHRLLEDRAKGPICSAAFNADYAAQLKKVRANVQAQLVYATKE
ncbi:DUF3857 domain-containing transglutaminase family protein [Noviluteimonas gilva]|uniref:DUF3857 domain-containing protein n=1 Tax=Noviluteimonas gilva TaxID=2682097 RepID=A0A7C9MN15_9GAMM|nr:DUF3857 and transglutaminase domain-containing protein [Lysobacter gilvus]MUV14907.1 DUF3857 domain-containing protein [Lysobacter gilvus]